jgi:hypothetical protein
MGDNELFGVAVVVEDRVFQWEFPVEGVWLVEFLDAGRMMRWGALGMMMRMIFRLEVEAVLLEVEMRWKH